MTQTAATTCRVCGSASLTPLFSLGNQFLSDFVPTERISTGPRCPIELEQCGICSLVQARYTPPADLLYRRHYWFRSGVTQTLRDALRDVVDSACQLVSLKPGDVVLDIGANDGTGLVGYPRDVVRVACEPATNLHAECRRNCEVLIPEFWNAAVYFDTIAAHLLRDGYQPDACRRAKVVTACGMFYDLDDPNLFIADVARVLAPDGVFIAQLMCAKQMLEKGDVGNLAHEHLEYYTLRSLQYLFNQNGMGIFDVEENAVNGGSYRVFAAHLKTTFYAKARPGGVDRVQDAIRREQDMRFADPATYTAWFDRVCANRDRCVSFLQAERARGKRIWIVGACYDEQTRAFTPHGFKRYDELAVGDTVLTLNPLTKEIQPKPIKEIFVYQYRGELETFYGRRHSLAVTPNHRMLVDIRNRSDTLLVMDAETLARRPKMSWLPRGWWRGIDEPEIRINRWANQSEYRLRARRVPEVLDTKDFMYLLGLYVGDGYTCTRDGGFSSNFCIPDGDKARGPMLATLERVGIRCRQYKSEVQVASKALVSIFSECGGNALEKRIPRWALEYAPQYLEHLLRGLVDSDGWYTPSSNRRYRTSSKLLAADVVELCVKLGLHPSVSRCPARVTTFPGGHLAHGKENYIVGIGNTQPEFKPKGRVPYDGTVWCLSVENENFLVERGGRVAFCGNSTKANVIAQFYGLTPELIEAAAERSPEKVGLHMVGTGIPIRSEDEFRRASPDYALVMPYAFRTEIMEREKAWQAGGGRFVFVLPRFEVV